MMLAVMAGCVFFRSSAPASLEGRYAVTSPAGWQRTEPGGADYAWFSPALSGAIYTDSSCGQRFEDKPLDNLLDHLTSGITSDAPLRQEELTLDGRAAMLRVSSGQLDGLAVQVGAVVLKKNGCIYDMLYIAPPASFEDGWGDFVSVISSFVTQRSL